MLSWAAEASAVCTEPEDLLRAQDAVHDVDAANLRQHLWGALQQSSPAEAGPIEALAQCMKELWDAAVPDPNLCTFLRDEQQPKLVLDAAKPVMFLGAFQVCSRSRWLDAIRELLLHSAACPAACQLPVSTSVTCVLTHSSCADLSVHEGNVHQGCQKRVPSVLQDAGKTIGSIFWQLIMIALQQDPASIVLSLHERDSEDSTGGSSALLGS